MLDGETKFAESYSVLIDWLSSYDSRGAPIFVCAPMIPSRSIGVQLFYGNAHYVVDGLVVTIEMS